MRVPAFGDVITTKIKDVPSDAFAPRGRGAHFLGCLDNVAHGVLVGTRNGEGWGLDFTNSFIMLGLVKDGGYDDKGYIDQDANVETDLGGAQDEFRRLAPTPPMGAGTQPRLA